MCMMIYAYYVIADVARRQLGMKEVRQHFSFKFSLLATLQFDFSGSDIQFVLV